MKKTKKAVIKSRKQLMGQRFFVLVVAVIMLIAAQFVAQAATKLSLITNDYVAVQELCKGAPNGQERIDEAYLEACQSRQELIDHGNAVEKFLATASDPVQVLVGLAAAALWLFAAAGIVMMVYLIVLDIRWLSRVTKRGTSN